MKILVSSPRHGSTVLFEKFKLENAKHNICHWPTGFSEWLKPSYLDISIEEKIDYVEKQRTQGSEFLYKIHAFHLFSKYKDGIVYDWFKDFYKGFDVYVLKRRDLWRAYISLLVHHTKGNQLWHNYGELESQLIEKCRSINFQFDNLVWESYVNQIDCLEKVEGKILYLEDLKIQSQYKPWNIDYEQFFEKKELQKIKEIFSNEFYTVA